MFVSAPLNVKKGEKEFNNSNLIIKYPGCRSFNLGRESEATPTTGGYSNLSLVE